MFATHLRHLLAIAMSDRRDRHRRRDTRAPSRSRCRFSANTRVSELHKELRQLQAEKTELESSSRKLRRQVEDVKKELRTSQRNEGSLREKIEHFASAEQNLASDINKLTRENARLQEELERAQQMCAEARRSKADVLQAVMDSARRLMDSEEKPDDGGDSSSRRGLEKRDGSSRPALARGRSEKRARRTEGTVGEDEDDDDSSSIFEGERPEKPQGEHPRPIGQPHALAPVSGAPAASSGGTGVTPAELPPSAADAAVGAPQQ